MTDSRVKLSLTAESLAAYPSNPNDRSWWSTEFRLASLAPAETPVPSVIPPTMDFGTVNVGSIGERDCLIPNSGSGVLEGKLSLPPGSPFMVVGNPTYRLLARESKVAHLQLRPSAEGGFTAVAIFTGGNGTTRILSGTGVIPPGSR